MKNLILWIAILSSNNICAQTTPMDSGFLSLKNGMNIQFYKLKKEAKIYTFYQKDSLGKLEITQLPVWIVDSVITELLTAQIYPIIDSPMNVNNQALLNAQKRKPKEKYASFNTNIGLAVGNLLEFNNPSGTGDKTTFSLNGSLDLMYRYENPNSIFNTSHELHWTIGLQKESLTTGSDLQRAQDDVQTLHDLALAFTKKKKWRFNLISKFNTSIFTIFDNNYFKDISGNGRIQSIMSPFSLVLSPGLQYQPIEPLKISVSPYSTEFYGVTSDMVSSKGNFITEVDGSGNFKRVVIKRQALEFNIWFDYRIKEWLEMQYRLGLISDYQLGFMNNGEGEGLFITRLKIIKDVYLSHRFALQSDIFNNITNPFITQNIQISLSKNF